jgi:sporulation integral membrane protein YtvI
LLGTQTWMKFGTFLLNAGNEEAAQAADQSYIMNFMSFLIMLGVLLLIGFSVYYLIHIGNNFLYRDRRITIGKKQIFFFVLFFFSVLILIGLYTIQGFLLQLIAPFLAAFAIAYILNPAVTLMDRKGIRRAYGILLIYAVVIGGLVVLSISFFPRIAGEIRRLIEVLPQYIENAYESFQVFYDRNFQNIVFLPDNLENLGEMFDLNMDRIQEVFFGAFASIFQTFRGFFTRLINIILTPIITFYFLKDREKFKQSIMHMIPDRIRQQVILIGYDMNAALGGFIRGQLLVALFVGTVTTISLLILRVEFAVLVGMIAGIANIIPYLGPVIGIIPAVFFALLDGPGKALWVIGVFTVIQQIESGIVTPRVVGKRVGIHPVFVMLSLMIGGRVFGILGMLIAVPSAVTVHILGKHFIALVKRI